MATSMLNIEDTSSTFFVPDVLHAFLRLCIRFLDTVLAHCGRSQKRAAKFMDVIKEQTGIRVSAYPGKSGK